MTFVNGSIVTLSSGYHLNLVSFGRIWHKVFKNGPKFGVSVTIK